MTNNQTNNPSSENKAPQLIAYHVTERGEKSYWSRIGAAWAHKDGQGFNLELDLIPAQGGKITLRTPNDKPDESA